MRKHVWATALLVPMLLLNIAGTVALADPIIGGTVTVDPVAPAITVTTETTIPSTTTPVIAVNTTTPITATTATTVNTTQTPVTGSVNVGAPGTTATVPITTAVAPSGTIGTPTIIVAVPTVPTVTGQVTAPIDTAGTSATIVGDTITAIGAIRTSGTGASATVTEPANGISANVSASAAICLLATAVGRTTLDPAALASLSTMCDGSPSTASGSAGATIGQLASVSADLAASLCLVANALALPAPISTSYLASLGLDTRCGTAPSTATLGSTATLLDAATIDANGAAAVCLIATAIAGLPATADLSTACGGTGALTPSLLSGGANGTAWTLGSVDVDLGAALCLVVHAVADLPSTATLATPCANTPSATGGQPGGNVAVIGANAAPNGPSDGVGSLGPVSDPAVVAPGQTPGGNDAGIFGIASLPSTSTVVGGAAGGLLLVGLGLLLMRRRQTAN